MLRTRLLALLSLACVLSAGPVLAQGKPDILIGHIGINSGPAGSLGRTQYIMVELAAEDINKAGGINGSKVKVETVDAELDPAKAVLRYREFATKNAVGVIGPMSGGQWETVAPLANQIKMPAITATASKPGITVRPWTLHIGPTDTTMIENAFAAIMKKYPATKKIAIIADVRQATGAATVEIFSANARKFNVEVVEVLEFSTGATDLSPLAIRVKNLPIDLVVVSATTGQALALAKDFVVQGMTRPVLAHSFIWLGDFVTAVGAAGANWQTWGWNTNDVIDGNNDLYKTVAPRYIERALKDPTTGTPNIANTTNAYDSMMLMAGILRARGIDGNTPIDKAREALKDGFMETKEFHGLQNYIVTPEGDTLQRVRLIAPDAATKSWKFAD